jgi:hypothetical protein
MVGVIALDEGHPPLADFPRGRIRRDTEHLVMSPGGRQEQADENELRAAGQLVNRDPKFRGDSSQRVGVGGSVGARQVSEDRAEYLVVGGKSLCGREHRVGSERADETQKVLAIGGHGSGTRGRAGAP